MAVPEQVRKQSEAIKQHFDELNKPPAEVDPALTPASEPVVVEPEADSVTEPVAQPPVPEQVPTEDPNSETYQQRYRTLQGMHNAANAQNRELAARVQQMEQLLASIQNAPPSPPPHLKAEEQARYLSDQERNDYGESIDVMRKVYQEENASLLERLSQMETTIGQVVSSIQNNVGPQLQQVAQRQTETAESFFWRELASTVPDWQQINNDKDFHSWLLDVDPLSGTTRQQHLEAAQQAMNAQRVAAFFKTFKDQSGKYKANTAAHPNRSAQSSELEKQVAPGKSRSTSTPNGQAPKTYTRADIALFFDEVRKGKYKGNETERNRIERDIFSAQVEGRIA